ncbi:MAG: hypothetical protein AB9880_11310 [Christensenellales bacterium]
MAVRTYVEVSVSFDVMGRATPRSIVFKGESFLVDRVIGPPVDAPALLAGGHGKRYTVRILGKETYLFQEEENRWFVEERGAGEKAGRGAPRMDGAGQHRQPAKP